MVLEMTKVPIKAAEERDPYVAIVEKGMNAFIHAEGFFLVNLLPWLQYLPSWFPGAGFINVAKEGHKNGMDMYLRPYELAKRLIVGQLLLLTKTQSSNFS